MLKRNATKINKELSSIIFSLMIQGSTNISWVAVANRVVLILKVI